MQHPTTEKLIDYLHGALSPEVDAIVHAHLDECTHCRNEYATEVQLSEMLRSQAALEERELPPMLKASIWQAIRDTAPTPVERLRAWLRPAYAVPVVAALLVAAYLTPGYLHGSNSQGPTIDAAYYLQEHAAMNSTVPFGDRTSTSSSEFEMTANVDQTAVSAVPIVYTADASR